MGMGCSAQHSRREVSTPWACRSRNERKDRQRLGVRAHCLGDEHTMSSSGSTPSPDPDRHRLATSWLLLCITTTPSDLLNKQIAKQEKKQENYSELKAAANNACQLYIYISFHIFAKVVKILQALNWCNTVYFHLVLHVDDG